MEKDWNDLLGLNIPGPATGYSIKKIARFETESKLSLSFKIKWFIIGFLGLNIPRPATGYSIKKRGER
jgi:hypothetical protein